MKQPIPPLSAGQDLVATYIIMMPQESAFPSATATGGAGTAGLSHERRENEAERTGRKRTKSRPTSRFPSPSRLPPSTSTPTPAPAPAALTRQITHATYRTGPDIYADGDLDEELPDLVLGVQVLAVEADLGKELTRGLGTHHSGVGGMGGAEGKGRKMSLAASLAEKAKHLKERGSSISGAGGPSAHGPRPAGTTFEPGRTGNNGTSRGTIPEGMDEQMAEHLAALQRMGVTSPIAINMGRIM